jgi:hypothetical protein
MDDQAILKMLDIFFETICLVGPTVLIAAQTIDIKNITIV